MAGHRTKQVELLLTDDDEQALAAEVVRRFPAVKLIDEWEWRDVNSPPVRESVLQCGSIVAIWGSHLQETVTGTARGNGTIDGPPISGAIVQWLRCRRNGDRLQSGRWAAAFDPADAPVAEFIRGLWTIVRSSTTNTLTGPAGDRPRVPVRRFHVGRQAYELAVRGELTLAVDLLVLEPEVAHGGDKPAT